MQVRSVRFYACPSLASCHSLLFSIAVIPASFLSAGPPEKPKQKPNKKAARIAAFASRHAARLQPATIWDQRKKSRAARVQSTVPAQHPPQVGHERRPVKAYTRGSVRETKAKPLRVPQTVPPFHASTLPRFYASTLLRSHASTLARFHAASRRKTLRTFTYSSPTGHEARATGHNKRHSRPFFPCPSGQSPS